MKTISCREAGFECDHVVKGQTEEEVIKSGTEHAIKESLYQSRRHNSTNERET